MQRLGGGLRKSDRMGRNKGSTNEDSSKAIHVNPRGAFFYLCSQNSLPDHFTILRVHCFRELSLQELSIGPMNLFSYFYFVIFSWQSAFSLAVFFHPPSSSLRLTNTPWVEYMLQTAHVSRLAIVPIFYECVMVEHRHVNRNELAKSVYNKRWKSKRFSSLRSADVFPVVASLPPKSDDRKYVCWS